MVSLCGRYFFQVTFLCHVGLTLSLLDGVWDNDLFLGRQWDDLVTPRKVYSPEIIQPSLLVMYEPRCEENIVKTEKLQEGNLPLPQYLLFGKYDTVTTPKYIWYDIDDRDDITKRYNPRNCPEYLYFKNGSSVFEPEIYSRDSGIRVLDWLWGKLAVAFTLENQRQQTVTIEIRGQRMKTFFLKAGEIQMVQTFISNIVLVTESFSGLFIHGMVIEPQTTSLTILDEMEMAEGDKTTWHKSKRQQMETLGIEKRTMTWRIAGNYLRNFKQPLLLPLFTKEGYFKTKIPKSLYKKIMTFYKANIASRRHESDSSEPLINERDVRCTIVRLSEDMVQHIASTLKPLMESWSNLTLELTHLYGIHEYYTGNILRNHVDRVSTHVISAILQIDQEMEGQPDWELEVITRDGKRKHTSLKPGEMLFYESATIIHGRPLPLQGKMYANAFLHYKPVENWKWHMHPDGHWIMHDGEPKEMIDQLVTSTTETKPKTYYHEEL